MIAAVHIVTSGAAVFERLVLVRRFKLRRVMASIAKRRRGGFEQIVSYSAMRVMTLCAFSRTRRFMLKSRV